MRVLVTGGSGFVGMNIVEALLARGDDVTAASNAAFPAYAQSSFGALPGTLSCATLDVTDADAVHMLVAQGRPQAIVHAAVITAGEARESLEFDRVVDVNIKGTAHVLAAAREHDVGRTLYVSSGSAYGSALFDRESVTEETPLQPDSLYAITKYASERVCARFRATRGLDVACVRLGSVFGPWERDTGVRDTLSLAFQIFRRAAAGELVVLPRREPRRDWVYARDVASGILAVLDAKAMRHTLYNVSAGAQWSDFALRWCEALRRLFPDLRYRTARESETANVSFLGDSDRALMSIARITADTAYRPRHAGRDVFADYAAWLEAQRAFYG